MVLFWIWSTDFSAKFPITFVQGGARAAYLNAYSDKLHYPIGPIINYAECSLSQEHFDNEKLRLGKMLLVFPDHSTHHVTARIDENSFMTRVADLAVDFDSVCVCLYWKDILNGAADYYLENGYECVSAGHMFDDRFLPRLKSLLRLSDMVVSAYAGTPSAISVFMGKPHSTLLEVAIRTSNSQERLSADVNLNAQTAVGRQFDALFHGYNDRVTDEQYAFIDDWWGISRVKTQQELVYLCDIAEDMYAKGETFYMNNPCAEQLQIGEYLGLGEDVLANLMLEKRIPCDTKDEKLYDLAMQYIDGGELENARTLISYLYEQNPEGKVYRDAFQKYVNQ
jgi:hypothetical protein